MSIRVRNLTSKIMSAEEAVEKFFPERGSIAFAGMAGTAFPKMIPKALAEHVSHASDQSRFSYIIYNGGSVTAEFDNYMSKINLKRRYPYGASSKEMRIAVNKRVFETVDLWLYEHSRWMQRGIYSRKIGPIDIAVVEATGVLEDGAFIPSLSVDAAPSFIREARKVIFEVNITRPEMLGIHDIYLPTVGSPIPIKKVLDRVGSTTYIVPESKIAAIVISEEDESEAMHYSGVSSTDYKIVDNIMDFLMREVEEDPNLKSDYVTIQPGAGPITSVLGSRIHELPISLSVWGEVAPTSWLPTLQENVKAISSSVLYTLPGERKYREILYNEFENLKKQVVLRPYEVANNPQIISIFNHIVVQQAIEVDIYGHVNVSHIGGNLYGGVGGSGDHTRPSYLTIVATPSITSSGVTRITPTVSHVDIPEHDVDVLVTEHGWVDLRALSPIERAKAIIDNCAHPKFKDLLWRYLGNVMKMGGHQPIDFKEVVRFWEDVKTST